MSKKLFKKIQEETCILTDPLRFLRRAIENINRNINSQTKADLFYCLLIIIDKLVSLTEKGEVEKAKTFLEKVLETVSLINYDVYLQVYRPAEETLFKDFNKERKKRVLNLKEIKDFVDKYLSNGDAQKEILLTNFPRGASGKKPLFYKN